MYKFISFMCFALIATAAANAGYNYQQPRPVQQNFQQQFRVPAQLFAQTATQFVAPAPPLLSSFQHNHPAQQQTIISKDIYIHSSPEETEEININQVAESVPNRKNYRIVFIKAPSQNIKFNVESLKRVQAANEEKTVIYVLAKKPDVTTIQTQLSEVQTAQKVHKPEVYFIKYKTQEEANRAQKEIQAQYDALGGSTQISDEGIAPVTSVIGSAGPAFGSGSINAPPLSNGFNFVQSASNNQQQFVQQQQKFVQQSIPASQGAASSISLGLAPPSNRYLPAKKK